MRAERSIPTPLPDDGQDVFLVMQWKNELDPEQPKREHWFFKYVYLPFLRFSFKYFHIPRVKQVTVEADKDGNVRTTFSWFENGGVFADEERADRACLLPSHGYKPLPWNQIIPPNSAERGGARFPRQKNPRRWSNPTLALILKDRKKEEEERATLAECLSELNHTLDRQATR